MTTYQKLGLKDKTLFFNVKIDDGASEACAYMLDDKETEDELMARVALHIEEESRIVDVPVSDEEAFPVMEVSRGENGEVRVKERSVDMPAESERLPVALRR